MAPADPFAASRAEALARWQAFLPEAPRYAARRNHVLTGHPHVTRLSPAVRLRLVTEQELLDSLLGRHAPHQVEKLAQEILWRSYWKGWLEQRPGVWQDYREGLAAGRSALEPRLAARLAAVEAGESGVGVMDGFARELVETGYLHNHARMWFASFWVHVEGLPWRLGAAFFERHLLDADPASNTLSWRWVAGLHTRGKCYLVRRSNLERYCAPALLAGGAGLERLEDARVQARVVSDDADTGRVALPGLPVCPADLPARYGLWLHEDDFALEHSALATLRPVAVAALPASGEGEPQKAFRQRALADALARAAGHFGCPAGVERGPDAASALAAWAARERLDAVVAMQPFVGPLGDALGAVRDALHAGGVALALARRREDTARFALARRGFFDFWREATPLAGARGE